MQYSKQHKVLIIGGAGYIGSKLAPFLVENDFLVEVYDTFWFGNNLPSYIISNKLDASELNLDQLAKFDSIIFLAGMSNDPMADFSPRLNFVSNLSTPTYVALMARRAGVKRFIFASSCSVYGFSPQAELIETDKAISDTPYGLAKLATEVALMNLVTADFSVIALRQGTISGYSPRLRFDLLINTMFKTAKTTRRIIVNSEDTWRPLLGISDAAQAYLAALKADYKISGIFNIASNNFTVGSLAKITKKFFQRSMNTDIDININQQIDLRSYRVNVNKSKEQLGFIPTDTPYSILEELSVKTKNINDFELDQYYNIKVFEKLNMK
jgi:nucleoside-diphosphate-sugar epimerase